MSNTTLRPILSEPSLHSSLIETTHGNRHGSRTHQNPSALKRKAARAARFDPPSATVPSVPADANVSLPDGDPAPAKPSLASPAHTDQDLLDLTYQSASSSPLCTPQSQLFRRDDHEQQFKDISSFVHTLNSPRGFQRKLDALHIKLHKE